MAQSLDDKRMRLRHAGACRACGAALEARVEAVYERSTRTVRCLACPSPARAGGFAEERSV
ncbi:hypothetical protein [Nocardioides deserti]|uniref:hypothetical protein n=1 Tax=Nocardioides deserti TaxID=1588644 RepID=UPI001C92F807|nr:hypothetical protein [Nocardioides deserti]